MVKFGALGVRVAVGGVGDPELEPLRTEPEAGPDADPLTEMGPDGVPLADYQAIQELIDFGVHMLDLLAWWLGPLEVEIYRDDAEGGVETECELRLRTAGGAEVVVELTRLRGQIEQTDRRGDRGVLEDTEIGSDCSANRICWRASPIHPVGTSIFMAKSRRAAGASGSSSMARLNSFSATDQSQS